MAKFNRKRSGSQKVKTQWNRDLMDYPQIEARITELFEKSGLEQNEEQYNGLFDTLVEMKQIKTLTTRTEDDTDTDMREKKEMLHNLYKSENADENSVDDIEGRIAEVKITTSTKKAVALKQKNLTRLNSMLTVCHVWTAQMPS